MVQKMNRLMARIQGLKVVNHLINFFLISNDLMFKCLVTFLDLIKELVKC